jgi:glutamine amidotransferase
LNKKKIGIVDYGIGNHASITSCLKSIGYHVVVSENKSALDDTDLLILPGVGAFPTAMKALHEKDLTRYLKNKSEESKPIIGICLGMQLLADSSEEGNYCEGLQLIPGKVIPFSNSECHVGWNNIKSISEDVFLKESNGLDFYFNHSYFYEGPSIYKVSLTQFNLTYASIIRKSNIVGIQFHPEKSQGAGRQLLRKIITELLYA